MNDDKREAFLEAVREIVRYWQAETRGVVADRISGCAHSILILLDGGNSTHPGCAVIPLEPGGGQRGPGDIAGSLHEQFYEADEP
jgi:hypothetical protein